MSSPGVAPAFAILAGLVAWARPAEGCRDVGHCSGTAADPEGLPRNGVLFVSCSERPIRAQLERDGGLEDLVLTPLVDLVEIALPAGAAGTVRLLQGATSLAAIPVRTGTTRDEIPPRLDGALAVQVTRGQDASPCSRYEWYVGLTAPVEEPAAAYLLWGIDDAGARRLLEADLAVPGSTPVRVGAGSGTACYLMEVADLAGNRSETPPTCVTLGEGEAGMSGDAGVASTDGSERPPATAPPGCRCGVASPGGAGSPGGALAALLVILSRALRTRPPGKLRAGFAAQGWLRPPAGRRSRAGTPPA